MNDCVYLGIILVGRIIAQHIQHKPTRQRGVNKEAHTIARFVITSKNNRNTGTMRLAWHRSMFYLQYWNILKHLSESSLDIIPYIYRQIEEKISLTQEVFHVPPPCSLIRIQLYLQIAPPLPPIYIMIKVMKHLITHCSQGVAWLHCPRAAALFHSYLIFLQS